ncbi:CPBP family intramembrane glutamic endopeptidase [Staphylococcus cohnii]|uniref:Type II CAAX endopeptidase family protein n=3 Tax=Staphylococcus cohnii TaxID=29382 RepID=A0ABT6J258_9STAP|nr:type II CAAX endopeptidase family protein [Staphylococcus cohnii]KKI65091.1 Protein of pXO2-46 [Staphylococcus cohnii subsp. cohnii]MCI2941050.1 CPBP family intramembrane metalloprotease [Staphylococcus cohnii]MDE1709200.1 type II CAAX endopeptidase family protein [Staphylococcus cohnii]MDH5139461.1 type II CAAX endopeptidase family protein [Staphylococcus cohnii]MDH5158148.1 type II CAAX endopeptidase family protein [Staphylococcus cohnii]
MERVKYRFKDIVWKDFSLIVILIVSMIVFTLIGILFSFVYVDHLTEKIVLKLSVVIQLLSYVVTVFSFYFLHIKDFKMHLKKNTAFIKQHYIFLIIVTIIMMVCSAIYNMTMQMLPDDIGFNETQNELELMNLFDQPSFLPFTFLLIVIGAPLVEEIFFRHLLIGELGKKFNTIVMGIISAILFSLMHVMGAESPFEIGSYIILAIAMVYAYIKSGCKLIASVSIHMLNNLISFIFTLITLYT